MTGASSGIGRACVHRLDQVGFRVLAGLRNIEDGEALRVGASSRVTPVHVDLSLTDTLERCAAVVEETCADLPFVGVVNNAGILVSGPVEFVPLDDLRQQLEINVVGQVALIQALLPTLRKFKGRIVNIGSTSGRIPSAFGGAYCASKFALVAISEVLRQELCSSGVALTLIEPGVVATPIWRKTLEFEERLEAGLPVEGKRHYGDIFRRRRALLMRLSEQGSSPDRVAEAVEMALTSRRPPERSVVGLGAKLKLLVFPLIPNALLHRLARFRNR